MAITKKTEGHLTITDLTDITNVYLEYCLALVNATVTNSYTFSGSGEIGWNTTYPTWVSGYQIWIRQVRIKEGIVNPEYGTPYLDTAVNQINNDYDALNAKVKNYWWDSTGAHIASGIIPSGGTEPNEVTKTDVSTYGYNSLVGLAGFTFGYNQYKAMELDGSIPALKFYKPSKTEQGNKLMELTGSALNFYGSSQSIPDATISANGMKLSKGGIEAGTINTSDYIYVWSENDTTIPSGQTHPTHQFNIGGSGNKTDWRIVAGNNFGVDKAGNLYASNANIQGTIKADYGYIAGGVTIGSGGTSLTTVANNASTAGYSVEIEVRNIDYTSPTATLFAHVYYKGNELASNTTPSISTISFQWKKVTESSGNYTVTNVSGGTSQSLTTTNLNTTYICVISN